MQPKPTKGPHRRRRGRHAPGGAAIPPTPSTVSRGAPRSRVGSKLPALGASRSRVGALPAPAQGGAPLGSAAAVVGGGVAVSDGSLLRRLPRQRMAGSRPASLDNAGAHVATAVYYHPHAWSLQSLAPPPSPLPLHPPFPTISPPPARLVHPPLCKP